MPPGFSEADSPAMYQRLVRNSGVWVKSSGAFESAR
jgi:hypothetical protein